MNANFMGPNSNPDSANNPPGKENFLRNKNAGLVTDQDEDHIFEEYFSPDEARNIDDLQTDTKPYSAESENLDEYNFDKQMVDYETNESVSDRTISDKVWKALRKENDLDLSNIGVVTRKGTVVLSGFVASRDEKIRAEMAIENIQGVEDIINNLTLKRMS